MGKGSYRLLHQMARKRVLSCDFAHETNTFSVLPTTLANFIAQNYLITEDEIFRHHKGTKSTLGATYEAGEKYGWEVIMTVAASANPAGRVASEIYESICSIIVDKCIAGSIDGVLLHLHGAMVSEHFDDAEGELLRRIRDKLSNDVPIFVTLDLHGNITPAMAKYASLLLAVRTYPHIDFYETAVKAADLLQKAMSKDIIPHTIITKRPMLSGLDGGRTYPGSPMSEIILRGEQLERDGKCLVASICAGFTAADIYEIGPSVTITVDLLQFSSIHEAEEYAMSLAQPLIDYAWSTKHIRQTNAYSISDATNNILLPHLQNNAASTDSKKLLVLADVTDNPGSGHYGDSTDLLTAVLQQMETEPAVVKDVVLYAIYDPAAALQGQALGVGNYGTITMGGRYDPTAGGGPITVYGKVVSLTDGCFPTYGPMGNGGIWVNHGLSVLFRCSPQQSSSSSHDSSGVEVVIISNNGQLLDLAQLTSMGIDMSQKKALLVKSKYHYRACLQNIAGRIEEVDGGGLGSRILATGEYRNVRRPIWPLDKLDD